jgi:hypothetical protein
MPPEAVKPAPPRPLSLCLPLPGTGTVFALPTEEQVPNVGMVFAVRLIRMVSVITIASFDVKGCLL